MDVSIIVVSYNTLRLTCDTLRSVFEHTHGIDFEVIVVDNASRDGSADAVRREFPKARLIALTENIGFGRANNRAFEVVRGRNLLLLNSDTLLHDNAVKTLSDYLDRHPRCGVCGGNLVGEDGRPGHSFRRVLPGMAEQWNNLFYGLPFFILYGRNLEYNYSRKPLKVGYITGADMMVRASVIAEVGGFDPDFFLYYEETELTSRIRHAGYSVVSIPTVTITHLHGKSPCESKTRAYHVILGHELFMQKVYGPDKARRIDRLSFFVARLKAAVNLLERSYNLCKRNLNHAKSFCKGNHF